MPERVGNVSPTSAARIEIRLRRLQQLFNSLDPSPFHERDLDQEAEDYIVESADEFPLPTPLHLVVYLPEDELPSSGSFDVPLAIHNYFAYRLSEGRRRLRLFFREGRVALGIGLAFLFVCVVLRQLALATKGGAVSEIAAEGLLIVGWVAMWRPLEIFLYEWWPIRRRCRILAKLAKIPVTVRASEG
ncbi:MAG: hypothetical protein ACXVCF_21945 [Isosphaeraceae bacterium]